MSRAWSLLLALFLGLAATSCKQGDNEPPPTPAPVAAAGEAPAAHAGHGVPTARPSIEAVDVDARGAAHANVATARVARRRVTPRIVAAGRVTLDESRLHRVTAWVEGRIQRLLIATTGASIRRGEPIAEIYSPDLVTTQQELLVAHESARALAGSRIEGVTTDAARLVEASRRRLGLLGVTAAQIAQIERGGRPIESIPILSSASGVVTRRLVQAGDWVAKGAALYEVADLSRVWIEADVYEYELTGLKPGLPVTIEVTAYPGEVFRGKVAFVQPTLSVETRTNTVRVELPNPDGRLKPDMLVTASIAVDRGTAIMVPADAVVDAGTRQVVWVEHHPGQFLARPVVVGVKTEDGYEILRGLAEGETIAVSGGFMLDASSQLDRAGGAHAGHGTAPAADPHAGHGR